jgi:hypothetical protein
MSVPRIIQDFRPDEIILAYWKMVTVIEEDAEIFPLEILKEAVL